MRDNLQHIRRSLNKTGENLKKKSPRHPTLKGKWLMLEAELPCASKDGEEYLHPQSNIYIFPRLEKAKSHKELQSWVWVLPLDFPSQ